MAHRPLGVLLAAAVTLLLGTASASAATFAVTSADDASDGTCDRPHCSLREAIVGANAGAGRIVGNRIGVDPRGTSPVPNGDAGVHAFGPVQIGGRSEAERNLISGNAVDLLLDGAATVEGNWIGIADDGFALENPFPLLGREAGVLLRTLADGAVIGRNVIAGQQIGIVTEGAVDRLTVEGNLVGVSLDGELGIPTLAGIQLGADTTGARVGRNTVIADAIGILVSGEGTHVEGNSVGLDRAGEAHGELPTRDDRDAKVGIVVDGTAENTTIGGGNTVSGLPTGIELRDGSRNTVLEGNRVGTDAEGMAARPNLFGVVIGERAGVRIGGRAAAQRNVISGNQAAGVLSEALTADAVIEGNYIGVGSDGVAPVGNAFGLELGREDPAAPTGGDGFVVGGTAERAGNRIAHNREDGVMVQHTAGRVALLGNEIFANGDGNASDLGIDFLGDGVSANGSQDAAVLPHFPLLTDADVVSAGTSVQGTIDHPAGHQVRIELFAGVACDDSGHGQGQTPLGAITLTAPGGAAAFSALVAAPPAGQRAITATATDLATKRTSEFSRCALSSAAPPVGDPSPDDPAPGPGDPQVPPAGSDAGQPAPPIGLPALDDDPRPECVVPKLVGITPAKAKKRLRASGCGVGKVTKPKRRRGKDFRLVVKRSSLRAGTVRQTATRIGLTLGYERR
jgi:CSLREA domain-containing protein